MKQLIVIGIVAVIVIAAGVLVYSTGVMDSEYWETENNFGIWQEEIILEYEDGTEQSLKLLQDADEKLFSTVSYNGNPIDKVHYKIYATAEGSGYRSVEIDDLKVKKRYYQGASQFGYTTKSFGGYAFDVGSNELIGTVTANAKTDLSAKSSGTYYLSFQALGNGGTTVNYRGIASDGSTSDWQSTSVPASKSLALQVSSGGGGQIVVTFSSGIGT